MQDASPDFFSLMKGIAHFILLIGFIVGTCEQANAQSCGDTPRADVRINEMQYAIDSHPHFVNFLELAGTPGQSLDCFHLLSIDSDCKVKSSLSLTGRALTGGYFVIVEDSARYSSFFGLAPGMQDSIVNTGTSAGAFWVVHNPAATAAGTSCENIGGTRFDAVGHSDSAGAAASVFGGEGQEFAPGLAADIGGSLFRIDNQDTNENSVDFMSSCQASATPGSPNADLPCPRVDVSPSILVLGATPQDVTLENIGSGPLKILDISLPTGFTHMTNCPASPASLNAGTSCTISVAFVGISPASGNLRILADDSEGEHLVNLASSSCIFCDDFEDQDASDWYAKKSTWIASAGKVSTTLSTKGDLLSPDYGGCTDCEFEARVSVTSGGRISLFGWYESGKSLVEICLMQDKQKLLVKQKADLVSAKAAASIPVVAGATYTVRATFDGVKIHVFIDGQEKVALNAAATPFGTVMFRVKSPSGAPVTGTILDVKVQ